MAVKPACGADDLAVGFACRADNELRALSGRGELGRGFDGFAAVGKGGDFVTDKRHRLRHIAVFFFGREQLEAGNGGDFHVDAEAVGIQPGFVQDFGRRFRNGFEMDVAVESVFFAQFFSNPHQAFHGVIRVFEDAGTQKQPFDIVAPVKAHGQIHHFIDRKRRARDVVAAVGSAISAVVDAMVGQQDFQQRYAAAVFGETVADARARRVAQALPVVAARTAARRAGNIIFGGIG